MSSDVSIVKPAARAARKAMREAAEEVGGQRCLGHVDQGGERAS